MDERLVMVDQEPASVLQSTTLFSASFPCIISSVELSLSLQTVNAASTDVGYVIVLVRDGNSIKVGNINFSDSSSFYDPESNVFIFGTAQIPALGDFPTVIPRQAISNRSERFMQGDRLIFASRATLDNSSALRAVVRFAIHI